MKNTFFGNSADEVAEGMSEPEDRNLETMQAEEGREIRYKKMRRRSVAAQRKQMALASMRMQLRSLTWLTGLRIQHCGGCGVGQQLQLQFDP